MSVPIGVIGVPTSAGAFAPGQAVAGLTITELNPAHTEEGSGSIARLAHDIGRGLIGP